MRKAKLLILILFVTGSSVAQVPLATHVQIVKAEDARRFDAALEQLIKSPNAAISKRAMLAAGRIGDEKALPALSEILEKAVTVDSAAMAAFAIGEIESIRGADAILRSLSGRTAASNTGAPKFADSGRSVTRFAGVQKAPATGAELTARSLEAAGKIAAANASDPRSKQLGAAVVTALEAELKKSPPSTDVCRLGLTAVLRARPVGSEETVRKFLAFTDPNVVADALNTLARLRAKNANRDARDLLETHVHAIVRANAARVLGAADDKDAVDVLIKSATSDVDSRVRVSAIRALAAIRVAKAADPLLTRGEALLASYRKAKKPNANPVEKNEFLEIATALSRILEKSGNVRAVSILSEFRKLDGYESTEVEAAFALVSPKDYFAAVPDQNETTPVWKQFRAAAAGFSQLAKLEDKGRSLGDGKETPEDAVKTFVTVFSRDDMKPNGALALPDVLRTYAEFKPADLNEVALRALQHPDVQVRAAAAGILADLPPTTAKPNEFPLAAENVEALSKALKYALENDVDSNDAILAILDALAKLNPAGSRLWISATNSPDYLVRKKAIDLLPKLPNSVSDVNPISPDELRGKPGFVERYSGKGTKNGQVTYTDADYRRALSRKNSSVSAVFTTSKGNFTINFLPEDAPLTVDNFIKLARAGYFNGLEVHRVVPNFVMQDGDPRGDGNGGPGWSIRCEINMIPYERGAVGMALSGKDTGGSQWFVTHSPQPHLDGGYTVFGKVNETGMKVVDNIVRGDKIISVRIVGR